MHHTFHKTRVLGGGMWGGGFGGFDQGYNAMKVILEVYASFVLQCTVSER